MGDAAKKIAIDAAEMWLVDTGTGKVFGLFDGFAIGRAEGDLILGNDGAVSSRHCVFHVNGNSVEIEDLGSRNGTFVGGQRIEAKRRLGLLPGSRLEIGNSQFEIQVGGEAPKPRATALELVPLSAQIQLDTIPAKTPAAWAAKAQRDLERNGHSERVEMVALSDGIGIPLRSGRSPTLKATSKVTGIRSQPAAPPFLKLHNSVAAYVFLAMNLVAYAWAISKGADPFDPSTQSLIAMGGNINGLTTSGQWWRLGSAMFAHAGAMHLASNMAVLAFLGIPVARMLGAARFSVVYLAGGLFGSVASVAFNAPNVVSVGASGSIFALVGALFAVLLMGKGNPRAIGKFGLASTANFLVRNIGLGVQGIDVAAHTAGLGAGFLLALLFFWGKGGRDAKRPMIGALLSFTIVLALFAVVPHKILPPEPSQFAARMTENSALFATLEKEYRDALADTKTGKKSQETFLKYIREKLVPGVDMAAERVSGLVAEGDREKKAKSAQLLSISLWKDQLTELVVLLETKDESHYKALEELQIKAAAANGELEKAITELRRPASER